SDAQSGQRGPQSGSSSSGAAPRGTDKPQEAGASGSGAPSRGSAAAGPAGAATGGAATGGAATGGAATGGEAAANAVPPGIQSVSAARQARARAQRNGDPRPTSLPRSGGDPGSSRSAQGASGPPASAPG